jgi:hypothetical protein
MKKALSGGSNPFAGTALEGNPFMYPDLQSQIDDIYGPRTVSDIYTPPSNVED